jgi:hypothetical protein
MFRQALSRKRSSMMDGGWAMRWIHASAVLVVLLASSTMAADRVAGTRSTNTISPGNEGYTIEATWDSSTTTLSGTETVAFTNLLGSTLTTVYLRTWPNGQSKCKNPFTTVSNVSGGRIGTFAPGLDPGDCTAVPIDLTTPVAANETGTISFAFDDFVPKNWNFRYGTSGSAWFFANAFPTLALTDGYGLHLEPYNLNGESMYSITADWNVTLTTPPGLQIPSTGKETSRTIVANGDQRSVITESARRDFALSIGTFDVYETKDGNLSIRFFKQPKSHSSPTDVLDWATEAVNAYTAWYGPYDATELDLAEGTWTTNGFEYPDFLMISPTRDIVYHEVAHQWWYNMVGDNQYSSPWLDESFAEFSNQRLQGTNLSCNVADPFKSIQGNDPLDTDMGSFKRYVGVVYVGGPCVIEALRRGWGEDLFNEFMHYLQTTYHGGVETTCDVQHAIRRFSPPGFDVKAFLQFARIRPGVGTAC